MSSVISANCARDVPSRRPLGACNPERNACACAAEFLRGELLLGEERREVTIAMNDNTVN